ncbi:caspase family protein [Pseudaminobacter sp. 19-2017]|uniref:Caspase family protein n=1 Tax=Pseudaminobacter soli (ex Zhang et al. 2022) TaxID=2831468 RepID=A0A942E353_9HYPH|nr:caspase family protein [Pseudaminobacter soli]MBS3650141.1 caspase family protein [Pseudaminobacter soli]
MSVFRQLLKILFVISATSAWITPSTAATSPGDPAPGKARLALVIGNSNYVSARYEDLANASNDAARLGETLKRLNFEVDVGLNLTAAGLDQLFRRHEGRLGDYSAVFIFYAGHGIQLNGENFLLPTDTLDPESVEKLTERAVRLNDVIARFADRDRQTFIFLDACRNNPMGSGNGLAQVEVGENTFVAFATQPGNVTVDGTGSNSPFTTAVLQSLEIPGLSVSDMMIRVRNETERLTLGRQVPWDQSNLREQFYFTEQQVIDSRELSATLNRILEVPNMKEKLLIQLASAESDLQSTVLMLGRELPAVRSIEMPGQEQGQQVASLSIGDGSGKSVASDLQALLVLGKEKRGDDKSAAFDLNHRVQTELSRVGCYRQAVDGVWGPGSRKALGEYLRRTSQKEDRLEPNVEILSDLFLRSGRICRQPVAAPKPVKTATVSGEGQNKAASGRGGGGKNSAPARSKPAAPPPDIGAGIGIGGVF